MALAGNDGRVLANVQTAPGEIANTHSEGKKLPLLMLGALGVVFGDIGTSPIYAFREALHASTGGAPVVRDDVLGVLSLIVWALTLIVTVKYVAFVLRADNRGEGGTLSLMALARASFPQRAGLILGIGICGASLFFGDAIITPAISVLSAVEGLEVVTPKLDSYVVPITLVILAVLFSVQRLGTGRVAAVFGPITAIWFLAIAVAGVAHIADDLSVLYALNPYYAVSYLASESGLAFVTIGAVFLAVTGAEALYVDLGHFGRKPIVLAWLALVFPSLLLNYFGQGAFVLSHGGLPDNPFFEMLPGWARGADGRIGDGGDGNCQPGGHFRRLLAGAAGSPAQHLAAHRGAAHVGDAVRTDLYAARQPAAGALASCSWSSASANQARLPPLTASRSPARC